MEPDYKELCQQLFGTTDVDELKKLSDKLRKKNIRNAGRKARFDDADVQKMQALLQKGYTFDEIADRFGTSRQVISKYLNAPPLPGYTLRLTLMYQTRPCTVIDVDFLNQRIRIQNRTDDLLHRAFGVIEEPTWADFEQFLLDRCFPRTRGNTADILTAMGLQSFDPLQIMEKTKGHMAEDHLWVRFQYYEQYPEVQHAGN